MFLELLYVVLQERDLLSGTYSVSFVCVHVCYLSMFFECCILILLVLLHLQVCQVSFFVLELNSFASVESPFSLVKWLFQIVVNERCEVKENV